MFLESDEKVWGVSAIPAGAVLKSNLNRLFLTANDVSIE
jgi:hypothetical protein